MVSAYASDQCLCLGQIATDQKSNEITAIPKLLELLSLAGSTVTIDAMGCQKDISKKIIERKADYILGVKENQKGLLAQIEKVFKITQPCSVDTDHDLGHGREETRKCSTITNLDFFDDYKDWPGLKTLIKVDAARTIKQTGKTENSTRYYISSKTAEADVFNRNVRSHWAIENKLHWVLDVTFGEDASRKRKGNSAENFALVTKIALTLLQKNGDKRSKPSKRLKAALSDAYREKLLEINMQ
jgi:predicted transposase YbfD/YdcC